MMVTRLSSTRRESHWRLRTGPLTTDFLFLRRPRPSRGFSWKPRFTRYLESRGGSPPWRTRVGIWVGPLWLSTGLKLD